MLGGLPVGGNSAGKSSRRNIQVLPHRMPGSFLFRAWWQTFECVQP